MSQVTLKPTTTHGDSDTTPDVSHYARKDDITRALIDGTFIVAVCGVRFRPVRDPSRFPVCERCKFIVGQLPDTPGAPSAN